MEEKELTVNNGLPTLRFHMQQQQAAADFVTTAVDIDLEASGHTTQEARDSLQYLFKQLTKWERRK